MSGPTMTEYSSLVSAGVAVTSLLCTGIAAVWGRLEYTNRLVKKTLRQCERREVVQREQGAIRATIIELLWQEVKRLAPRSEILKRARVLLDDVHRDIESETSIIDQEDEE